MQAVAGLDLDAFKASLIAQYGVEGYYALLGLKNVFKRLYRSDRVAFVYDCFNWKEGKAPKPYQLEALGALDSGETRVALQSLHGVGKTTTMAWVTLHFALTRDGDDWKGIATASAWRQLEKYYFPEVHKWARMINWGKVGRSAFNERTELQKLNLSLATGAFSCVASDNAGMIEGAHSDNLAYLFDESKLIPSETFDAAEGAFANEGVGGAEAFAFAASTPGVPSGRFYEICSRKSGLENWKHIRVKLEDAIAAGQVSPIWADNMRKLWGEESSVFRNKVLGEFAAQDEDAVIPLSWVEAANERYKELEEQGLLTSAGLTSVGADISDGGGDLTVTARRYGNVCIIKEDVDAWVGKVNEQMQTARKIGRMILTGDPSKEAIAIVDGIGVGSGVVSALVDMGYKCSAFVASAGTDKQDPSGTFGFLNLRAFSYWHLRELLNPENDSKIALPPIPQLIGDLTTPKWKEVAGGKIKIESKEDIKKRNDGRSTDYGDAVVMAFVSEALAKRRAQSW
jgi:hypothetical protein